MQGLALDNKVFFVEDDNYLSRKSNPGSYKYFGNNIYAIVGLSRKDTLRKIDILNNQGINVVFEE